MSLKSSLSSRIPGRALTVFLLLLPVCLGQQPSVTTKDGATLLGKRVSSYKGLAMDAFLGIPYGEKPERFQKSTLKLLTGSVNVAEFGPSCLQSSVVVVGDMSEDCLFIKVLRPAGTTASSSLPVLFWPQGGGYNGGNNRLYDWRSQGDNFVSRQACPIVLRVLRSLLCLCVCLFVCGKHMHLCREGMD